MLFHNYPQTTSSNCLQLINAQLSDEEAWDVAAFINSQPRPKHPFLQTDWPDISKKPYDHPFGPYTDSFPEIQHKYGPFEPIVAFYKRPK